MPHTMIVHHNGEESKVREGLRWRDNSRKGKAAAASSVTPQIWFTRELNQNVTDHPIRLANPNLTQTKWIYSQCLKMKNIF